MSDERKSYREINPEEESVFTDLSFDSLSQKLSREGDYGRLFTEPKIIQAVEKIRASIDAGLPLPMWASILDSARASVTQNSQITEVNQLRLFTQLLDSVQKKIDQEGVSLGFDDTPIVHIPVTEKRIPVSERIKEKPEQLPFVQEARKTADSLYGEAQRDPHKIVPVAIETQFEETKGKFKAARQDFINSLSADDPVALAKEKAAINYILDEEYRYIDLKAKSILDLWMSAVAKKYDALIQALQKGGTIDQQFPTLSGEQTIVVLGKAEEAKKTIRETIGYSSLPQDYKNASDIEIFARFDDLYKRMIPLIQEKLLSPLAPAWIKVNRALDATSGFKKRFIDEGQPINESDISDLESSIQQLNDYVLSFTSIPGIEVLSATQEKINQALSQLQDVLQQMRSLKEQEYQEEKQKKEREKNLEAYEKQVKTAFEQIQQIEADEPGSKTLEELSNAITSPVDGIFLKLTELAKLVGKETECAAICREIGLRLNLHWTYTTVKPLIFKDNKRSLEHISPENIGFKMEDYWYFLNESEFLNGKIESIPVREHNVATMEVGRPVRLKIRETVVGKIWLDLDDIITGKTQFGSVSMGSFHEREAEIRRYLAEKYKKENVGISPLTGLPLVVDENIVRVAMRSHAIFFPQSYDSPSNPGLSDKGRKMFNVYQYFVGYANAEKDEDMISRLPPLLWAMKDASSEEIKFQDELVRMTPKSKHRDHFVNVFQKPPFRAKFVRSAKPEIGQKPHLEAGFIHFLRKMRIGGVKRSSDGVTADFSFYNLRDADTEQLLYWIMPFNPNQPHIVEKHPDVERAISDGSLVVSPEDYKSFMVDLCGIMQSLFDKCFGVAPKNALATLTSDAGLGNLTKAIDDGLHTLSGAREYLVTRGVPVRKIEEKAHKGEKAFQDLVSDFKLLFVVAVLWSARDKGVTNFDREKLRKTLTATGFLTEEQWETADHVGIDLGLDYLQDLSENFATTLKGAKH